MVDALAQGHVAVNRPFPLRHGGFTASIQAPEGVRHLQLFAFAPGSAPGWQMTEEQARHYGQTVAHLHEVADRFPYLPVLPTLNEEVLQHTPAQILSSFLDENTSLTQELKRLTTLLQERLMGLTRTLPTYGFCHADCHKMNVLCTQDGQLTLIDFDCVGYSWRAYELSVFLWSFSRTTESGDLTYDQQIWDAYLHGYQQVRSLDAQTLDVIPWFVLVRHLWWMAIDLHKIRQELVGQSWLDAAWFERHFNRIQQWMQLFSLS
jgi:Ser/Thr protein kinase RdoA (MazF antagonist)